VKYGIDVQADQMDLTNKSLTMEDEKVFFTRLIPYLLSWTFSGFTNSSRTRIHTRIARSYVCCGYKINSSCLGSTLSSVISSWPPHPSSPTIALTELKKLQSLLNLALAGEHATFREDVRVSIARSGLYEWLLKVISVSGLIDGEEGKGMPDEEANKDRDREKDHKPMLGIRIKPLRCHPLLIPNRPLMPLNREIFAFTLRLS
jgi:hypothetical protein